MASHIHLVASFFVLTYHAGIQDSFSRCCSRGYIFILHLLDENGNQFCIAYFEGENFLMSDTDTVHVQFGLRVYAVM